MNEIETQNIRENSIQSVDSFDNDIIQILTQNENNDENSTNENTSGNKSQQFIILEECSKKIIERDTNFYNDENCKYYIEVIPQKYIFEDEIKSNIDIMIDKKLGDENSYDYIKLNKLIDEYEKKLDNINNNNYKFDQKIFKALKIDEVLKKYKKIYKDEI